ncbi:MAG: hydantoinase/oxoprolinase family protein [Hyphomicrobiaceae bacterium]
MRRAVAAALAATQTLTSGLAHLRYGRHHGQGQPIRDGKYETTPEYEVGGGASGNRWMHGTGHPIRVPVIDLAEVSGRRGLIAWVDCAGAFALDRKAPVPSPVPCKHGRGGTEPTVTDCNLMLAWTRVAPGR